jgi:hypothetical protein
MARTRAQLAAHLTAEQRQAAAALQRIPNVGPAMAADLLRLGVADGADLASRQPDALYEALGALDGQRPDPCVWDVFAAAVAYARGEPARPWWHYTAVRKARQTSPPSGRTARGSRRG